MTTGLRKGSVEEETRAREERDRRRRASVALGGEKEPEAVEEKKTELVAAPVVPSVVPSVMPLGQPKMESPAEGKLKLSDYDGSAKAPIVEKVSL